MLQETHLAQLILSNDRIVVARLNGVRGKPFSRGDESDGNADSHQVAYHLWPFSHEEPFLPPPFLCFKRAYQLL